MQSEKRKKIEENYAFRQWEISVIILLFATIFLGTLSIFGLYIILQKVPVRWRYALTALYLVIVYYLETHFFFRGMRALQHRFYQQGRGLLENEKGDE